MHISYSDILSRPADFRVKYEFYPLEQTGRTCLPHQGIRLDFTYYPFSNEAKAFMIWPEFETEDQNVILDTSISVPKTGTARMWIINPELRALHRQHLTPGVKGHLLEGKKIADCEVTELLGLHTIF